MFQFFKGHGAIWNTNMGGFDVLWGVLDLRHVIRSKKVLVFGAMEDITNDKYLARS